MSQAIASAENPKNKNSTFDRILEDVRLAKEVVARLMARDDDGNRD